MRRLSSFADSLSRALFTPGAAMPSPALVFLSVALVSALQIPASLILRAGYISAGVMVNELIVMAGVPLALVWFLGFDRSRTLPFKIPSAAAAALVVILTLGAVVVIDYATSASEHFLPLPEEVKAQYELIMKAGSSLGMAWKFLILCLLPGLCEEVFFRGFCQGSLAARLGNTKAILVTAVIFALLHGNPWYLHLYIFLGILFGWVFAVTGSLWASILCHVLNNSWTFFNHARGFELPLKGESFFVNAAIFLWGAVFFLAAAAMLRRLMQHRQ